MAIAYANKGAHLQIHDLVSHYCHRAIFTGYLGVICIRKEGRKEG